MRKGPTFGTTSPPASIFKTILPVVLIFCATAIAYLPSFSGEFIWNDSDYVTAPALRSLDGLARIWTEPGATEQYYPLLHSAFWVQHRIFGDSPLGYHLVTLLLHIGSAVLFGLIVRRLFDNDAGPAAPGSERRRFVGVEWVAALLFALHPVHVESVAWITEQKNTLSLAFYLAAALVYLRFDATRQPRIYFAALALFGASLACKTVTATLPAALLVVFWWKRGRIDWRRDVWPLLPWLVFGVATGLFSSWVEQTYLGAKGANFELSMAGRLLVAGRAIWFYVGKLVWPFGLNFVYPRWTVDAAVWWQWLFPLGALAVVVMLWLLRRRTRGPLAAFLFFVGSLFPVLGFVNLYGALYSWVWDHWQYLPDLGLLVLAAAGLTAGWRRVATPLGWLGSALAVVFFMLLGALTWSHCGMFHDNETLYLTTIARNPGASMAYNNLGTMRVKTPGRQQEAIAYFEETLRLSPDFAEAHNNLGAALAQLPGRLEEAIAHYQEAVRLKPNYVSAHNNLGLAWARTPGRQDEAIAQFEEAVRLQPGFAMGWYNLGLSLLYVGKTPAAVAALREAVRLAPDDPRAQHWLAEALKHER